MGYAISKNTSPIKIGPLFQELALVCQKISKNLSKKNIIYDKVISLNNILNKEFKKKKPKFIISGMNPHASENGIFGNEEKKFLIPQIKKIQKKILI